MKMLLPPIVSRFCVSSFLLVAFNTGSSAVAAPSLEETNPNLASPNHGAQVECTTPDGRIAPLAMGDETLSCSLQQGLTTFVIKLPSTTMLDHLTFVNENTTAAGELKISISNDQLPATSPKWVDVDGSVAFAHKRLFNLSMVGVEARYVRLSFEVENAGRIAAVGLYGGRTLDHSAWQNTGDQKLGLVSRKTHARSWNKAREYDYATVRAQARVIYVSSGVLSEARPMIDDKKETTFRFAANDKHPTTIVELGSEEEIHRVTALYKMHAPGRLDVYLLNDTSKGATDLNYQTPIASVTDEDGDGEAAVDFDPQGARFVAVRFTPTEGFGAGQPPFEIAEIDAFGSKPSSITDAMEAPDLYAVDYTAAPFPGQSTVEISTSLGTLAIPPTLPVVSP